MANSTRSAPGMKSQIVYISPQHQSTYRENSYFYHKILQWEYVLQILFFLNLILPMKFTLSLSKKQFTKFSSSYEKTCSSDKRVQDKTPSRNLTNLYNEVQNRILKMMWSLKSRVQWKDWTFEQSTCARLAISKLSSGSLRWNWNIVIVVAILHFDFLIMCA